MPVPIPALVPILRFLREQLPTLEPSSETDQEALQHVVAYVVQVLDQLPGNQLLFPDTTDAPSPFYQLEALHVQFTHQYVALTPVIWERTLELLDTVLTEAIGDAPGRRK